MGNNKVPKLILDGIEATKNTDKPSQCVNCDEFKEKDFWIKEHCKFVRLSNKNGLTLIVEGPGIKEEAWKFQWSLDDDTKARFSTETGRAGTAVHIEGLKRGKVKVKVTKGGKSVETELQVVGIRKNTIENQSEAELDRILRTYQVEEEETIIWSPNLGSFSNKVPDSMKKSQELTITEARMLDKIINDEGLVRGALFEEAAKQALAVAKRVYPDVSSYPICIQQLTEKERNTWQGNDGHRDAFRHAFWNALLTRHFGAEWTRAFTTAHEGSSRNNADRLAMDLYNNEVGRKIAVTNPYSSNKDFERLIKEACDTGKLVVIAEGGGHLEWSNNVPVGEHGYSILLPLEGDAAIPTPLVVDPDNQSAKAAPKSESD